MSEHDQAKGLRDLVDYSNNQHNADEVTVEETVMLSRKVFHSKEEKKKRKKSSSNGKKKKKINWGLILARFLVVIFLCVPFAIWYMITQINFSSESIKDSSYEIVKLPIYKSNEPKKPIVIPEEDVEQEELEDEAIENEETDYIEENIPTHELYRKVQFHTVKAGENLDTITKAYYGSTDEKQFLMEYNSLLSEDLRTGQILSIPIIIPSTDTE